jgi:hypothetical protein
MTLDRAGPAAVSVRAMSTEPLTFLLETYPAHFARGVAALAADPGAASRLADIRAARGAVQVVFEGEGGGEVFLAVDAGVMTASRTRPALPVRFCVAAPHAAARGALALLEESGRLEDAEAPVRAAGLTSARMDKLIEKERLAFHVIVKNVPELETITIRVGVGVDAPPEKPGFTVTLDYDDLEDVRAGDLTPQQLFMTKLKIVGDASRAMTLAMTMMQQAGRR